MTRVLLALSILALAWLAPAQPAHALGCLLLGCDCTVTASDIAFDDISPLLGGEETAIGELDIACTGLLSIGAGVTVEIGPGHWGAVAARKMRSDGGDLIGYNIYKSGAHSAVWGQGAQALQINGGLLVLGAWSARRDMFAMLEPNPAMTPGSYSDNVVVRIIW